MINKELLKALKKAGTLSDQVPDLGFCDTGSVAINEVVTGNLNKGIPIGGITQIKGESSTAKTIFLTHILRGAQKKGYYAVIDDTENSYSKPLADKLGIDPKNLIYSSSRCIEDAFELMENTVKTIREFDATTPIVYGLDSIAVLPTRKELEADDYEQTPMDGAIRAKVTGGCLRKANSLMRKYKVGLVIINQIRSKTGVMHGSPDTIAAGGRSLEYYLAVDLVLVSNKSANKSTGDRIINEYGDTIGITGTVRNKKNKCGVPFKECPFKLIFDEGLNRYYGAINALRRNGIISVPSQGWFLVGDTKFQKGKFLDLVEDLSVKDFDIIRDSMGLTLTDRSNLLELGGA
jgi:recombination protein RecA